MAILGLITLVIISILSFIGYIPMFTLLFISGFFTLYCFVTLLNKNDNGLSDLGKVIFVIAILGLVYSICELFFNIDLRSIITR